MLSLHPTRADWRHREVEAHAVCCLLCSAVLAQHWDIEQIDTAVRRVPNPPYECQLTFYDLDSDSNGNPLILLRSADGLPGPAMPPRSYVVVKGHRTGGNWNLTCLAVGWNTFGYGYDILQPTASVIRNVLLLPVASSRKP